MNRPTCKTCPFWQESQAEGQSCHHGPPPWHPAPPWGFCGHHPMFPSYIAAHTYGEMASGGPATNAEEWRQHHGSTATALMKDIVAAVITDMGQPPSSIEPSNPTTVEWYKPSTGSPVEPVPRWVDGEPTGDGTWLVQWPRGSLQIAVYLVTNDLVYRGVKRSFGPIPPPPSIAAGAAKPSGASIP